MQSMGLQRVGHGCVTKVQQKWEKDTHYAFTKSFNKNRFALWIIKEEKEMTTLPPEAS